MNYRYIVVEGSIGSGKSDLARRLAEHFGMLHLPEQPENNLFLEQFYKNASNHGLATELQFLLHYREAAQTVNREVECGNQQIVSDFLLEKDQIFVPTILDGRPANNEQTLYWEIKRLLLPEYPAPDLVIYLQTSDEIANKRLEKAGNPLDRFPEGYLNLIHAEYRRFFHLYEHAPLLIVNADEMNFDDQDHFRMLIDAMLTMQGSRHYLNFSG